MEKPLLAIFTIRDVEPFEELCFSYFGTHDETDEVQKQVMTSCLICTCLCQ